MKHIIVILVLFAMLQNVNAFNIFPVRQNQGDVERLVVRYPILRCGLIDRPVNEEVENGLINEGSVDKPKNPQWRNPFSTESTFRCKVIWVEKEVPNEER